MQFHSGVSFIFIIFISSLIFSSFSISFEKRNDDFEEEQLEILFEEIQQLNDLEILLDNNDNFDDSFNEFEEIEKESYWDNVWDENPVFFGLILGGFCIFICFIFIMLGIYCCCCKNSKGGHYDTDLQDSYNVNDLSRAEMSAMPFNRRGSEFARIENRPSSRHQILTVIPIQSKTLNELKEFLKEEEEQEDMPPPYSPSWATSLPAKN